MFLQRAITTIKPIVRSIHTTPSTRDSLVDLRYLNIPQENDDFHTLKTDFEKITVIIHLEARGGCCLNPTRS